MYLALIIVIAVVCFLLVLAVLAQNSKGGGVSPVMGGSTQLMGVQRTSDLLEKITWGLAVSLFVLCLSSNFLIERPEEVVPQEQAAPAEQQAPAAAPAPAAE